MSHVLSSLHDWSIRKKVITLGLFSVVMCGLVLAVAYIFISVQYDALRSTHILEYSTRVETESREAEELRKVFSHDYGRWDDMVTAVLNRDIQWLQDSENGSLSTFGTDYVWILARNKETLYQERGEHATADVSLDLTQLPNEYFLQRDHFEVQNGNLIHFFVAPVINSTKNESEFYGYFVVAKVWNQYFFSSLGDAIGARAEWSSETTRSIPEKSGATIIIPKPLYNASSVQVGTAEFSFYDPSLELMIRSLIFLLGAVFFTGVLLITLTLRAQYHWVVSPVMVIIRKLHAQVHLFPSHIKKTDNEMGILTQVVDEYISQQNIIEENNATLERTEEELSSTLEQLNQSNAALEEKLQANLKLSKAVESSTNSIVITDQTGIITYVNPAWVALNGYSKEEVIGKNTSLIASGKTDPDIYREMWRSIKAGETYVSDNIINRRKDGTEYFARLSVYPIEESGKRSYVGLLNDISKAREVDRMKTEFISMVSHQLRTPLSAMRWFGELLLQGKGGALVPKQKEIAQNLYSSTLRMIALVDALLDVTRLESGRIIIEPIPTDLDALVRSLLSELQPRLDAKHITLRSDVPSNIPPISLDQKMIREVYVNLLTNAIKYTAEGGTITISVREADQDILTSIADTGLGIPKDEQDKVFTKFYRGSNVLQVETDGTGLGLYLVKAIIESSGGKIWFESTEGVGTTFHFTLPKTGMIKKTGSVTIGT